jgi:hypothetical protein
VADLVSGVADVIAARATQTRVRPTQWAREVGPLDLSEALQLTALIARRDRGSAGAGTRCRGSPAGLEESAGASLDEAALVASALQALEDPLTIVLSLSCGTRATPRVRSRFGIRRAGTV